MAVVLFEAYLKGKISVNGLSGVTNFINISTVAAKKSNEFLPHIYKAEKFYNETSKYFNKNPEFLVASYNLFWFGHFYRTHNILIFFFFYQTCFYNFVF